MKWLTVIPWVAAASVLLPVFLAGCAFGYMYARARMRGNSRPARVAAHQLIPISSTSVTGAELALDLAQSVPPAERKDWMRTLWKRWESESMVRRQMH